MPDSRQLLRTLFWAACIMVWLRGEPRAEKPAAAEAGKVVFETHVAPIFEARCVKCHGQGQTKAGLDVRRKFAMLKGGDSGPAIVPGKPGESLLIERIVKGEMPPPEEGRLDDRQLAVLRRWIEGGALTTKTPEPPLDEADVATRLSAEDRAFWSFQPPKRPKLPRVKSADRVRTPIDVFLLARLEAKGLSFNPDAPRSVLLRRLCFDLTGLPPTPEQLDQFLADDRPGAYERLVDRLLASPAYGERWGRHWLDVAGYADSDGYLDADRLRPEAWRYRDYVIGALNDDLPYDQFLTEQLAGDELSDWRRAPELTPEMQRQLVATGFLRTALDPTYPGYTEPNEIYQVLADTMQIVGTTCLGLTIHCARCHAHKYDPVSQRDYYALQAVFLPALDPARWQPSGVRGIGLASEPEHARVNELNKQIDQRVAQAPKQAAELTERYRKKLVAETLAAAGKPADEALVTKLFAALLQPADKRTGEQKKLVAEHAPKLVLSETELSAKYADFAHELQRLKAGAAAEQAQKKTVPVARALSDLDGNAVSGKVLLRGDYNKPGPAVDHGVPEVLAPAGFRLEAKAGYKTSGRRLALARWLTDAAHPLTARVQVSRIWQHHFGRGLVPTVANFGRSGVKPTHPELLDWLACEFASSKDDLASGGRQPPDKSRPDVDAPRNQGADAPRSPGLAWSQKALHRLIVTSTVYRQSSAWDAAKAKADPDNVLLGAWQPQRHEGEVLRDSILAVSAKLNRLPGGTPAPVMRHGDGSVTTADDAQGNRRSIYLIVRRSQHLTMLDLFDTPMMEVNCPERSSSIVPLQALAMLHGPFAEASAAALGERIVRAESNDEARITYAYRLLFSREPRAKERAAVHEFLKAVSKETPGDAAMTQRATWIQAALVLLNSNEFVFVH